jgi:iron complex outermembrane receptor protein
MIMQLPRAIAVAASILLLTGSGGAQNGVPIDLTQVPLEDLMDMTVTSVARKEQKLSQTAAAVFVITQEDIRRSGAATIPDILRMAPGVNVARIDANTWAIGIRGFNGRYSNKILVLIDNRSVYMPSFSGVYWDQLEVPLEDVERIEIIRGPGGSAWGANAMNGVINIITMNSKATQKGLAVSNAGSSGTTDLVQYGGEAGKWGAWRGFGSYSNTGASLSQSGGKASDDWHSLHGGFRADLEWGLHDSLMLQGDLYETGEGQTLTTVLDKQLPTVATFNDPISVASGDLQALWTHTLRNGSEISLNVYYNDADRVDQAIDEVAHTFDVDFQQRVRLNASNDLVWGLGYRAAADRMTNGYDTFWWPQQRTNNVYSLFLQDEIKVLESLRFTLGSKLETNGYTGFEYEPNARLSWTPGARHTFWVSASQAIRQPSRQDVDLSYEIGILPLPGNGFGVLEFRNNSGIKAEQLRDYEGGYRTQLRNNLSLDIAGFRGYYHHLETTEPQDSFFVNGTGGPHEVFPLDLGNSAAGRTYGGEIFATWNVNKRWRLSPGFDLMHMFVYQSPLSRSSTAEAVAGDTPKHQIHLRSSVDVRSNLSWDTTLDFIGSLNCQESPAYTRLDMQLRWRPGKFIEIDAIGENLLRARHTEFSDSYEVDYTQIQRSYRGRIAWRF